MYAAPDVKPLNKRNLDAKFENRFYAANHIPTEKR